MSERMRIPNTVMIFGKEFSLCTAYQKDCNSKGIKVLSVDHQHRKTNRKDYWFWLVKTSDVNYEYLERRLKEDCTTTVEILFDTEEDRKAFLKEVDSKFDFDVEPLIRDTDASFYGIPGRIAVILSKVFNHGSPTKGVLYHLIGVNSRGEFERTFRERGVPWEEVRTYSVNVPFEGVQYHYWMRTMPESSLYGEWVEAGCEFTLYFYNQNFQNEVVKGIEIWGRPAKYLIKRGYLDEQHGMPALFSLTVIPVRKK